MSVSTLTLVTTDIVATQTIYAANELARFDAIEDWATDVKSICGTSLQTTGNQTVSSGVKTFSVSPIVPTPTTDYQASTKKYVDDQTTARTITAWVNVTGRSSAGAATVNGSFNVTGVTRDALTGDYTVTWDTDFADTNYCVVATASDDLGAGVQNLVVIVQSKTAGTATMRVTTTLNVGADPDNLYVMAIGDQ